MTAKRPDNTRPLSYVLLRKYGLAGALQVLRDDVGFDLRHRVNTALPVPRRRLYPPGSRHEQNRYVPSTFGVMEGVLRRASELLDIGSCGFVDYGSGKGKSLIAAARHPFRSVRGVEISERLHRTAERNIRALGLGDRVSLVAGSATDLALLPHERVLYLFNPFTGDVLERVLGRIAGARRDGPGLLIYVNPTESAQVRARFEPIGHDFIEPGHCEVVYYALPEGGCA